MNEQLRFISRDGNKKLTEALDKQVTGKGHVAAFYDEEARSIVVAVFDKKNITPRVVGWNIYGPVAPNDAGEELAAAVDRSLALIDANKKRQPSRH